MRIALIIVLACIVGKRTCAQENNRLDNLLLEWIAQEADYNGLSEISLINKGDHAISTKDWTIYFNSGNPKNLDPVKADIHVKAVNGDFFQLYVDQKLNQIQPGQRITAKIISRKLKNQTDLPKGFYVVFNEDKSKGLPINYTTSLNYCKGVEREVLKNTYLDNSRIDKIELDVRDAIIPKPKSLKKTDGLFLLNHTVTLDVDPVFQQELKYFNQEIKHLIGQELSFSNNNKGNKISIHQNKAISNEGYHLIVQPHQIIIQAANPAGAFYAIQTLKQLFPANIWKQKQAEINIKCLEIEDEPRFVHRAMMMDIARNYQPKEMVMKLIDVLALYKVNVLHFHFNDDEGWRIEIPGLPELTTVGSKRGHTLDDSNMLMPSYGSGPDNTNTAGSGFLSRKDFVEILKYATERHVKVIPEIETLGHARAAIKSMDARYQKLMKNGKEAEAKKYLLRDLNDKSQYLSIQNWTDNIINPAVPSVYTFIEKVIDELILMYKEAGAPLNTIHMGGDEVPEHVWEKSPIAQKLVKDNASIASIDELWYYYFSKVNQLLKKKGMYLSGWEEIGLKKAVVNRQKKMVLDHRFVHENFHVDVWNNLSGNEDLAYQMANAGYKVVLTNVTNLYIDMAYSKSCTEIGQYWGGYVGLEKPFSFIPLDYYKNQKEDAEGNPIKPGYYNGKQKLTSQGIKNIVGLQSPLWSEIITTPDRFEYLLLPKLLGFAERSWSVNPEWAINEINNDELYRADWSRFIAAVGQYQLPLLSNYNKGFAYRVPIAGIISENGVLKANTQFHGFNIRYTTDGSEPNLNSPVYNNDLKETDQVTFRVFDTNGRGGMSVKY